MPAFLNVRRKGWRSRLVTLSHIVTWQLGTRFPRTFPMVFVVGYAKSGTTWASQLVADYLQLSFPRLSLIPIGFPAAVHGHERVWRRYPYCAYVMRDGRDALVSLYFHLCRDIPPGDHPKLRRIEKKLFPKMVNRDNVKENIGPFVAGMMTRLRPWTNTWGEHVSSYLDAQGPGLCLLKYENLLSDGASELADAMSRMTGMEPDYNQAARTVEKFSFASQSGGREAGSEDRTSFIRKGQAGDWMNHFTREAAEIFDRHCGEALIRLGYEKDNSWIDRTCA